MAPRLACWGRNDDGQLGTGDFQSSSSPVPVLLPTPGEVTLVAAGWLHTCAWTSDGAVYCWGANDHGQCGTSLSYAIMVPNLVEGL
jgi:alpha-tubulin suppressor-like RCC1 family protein